MTHFGIICPQLSGHLNVVLPLGKELQRRGHYVTFFGIIDAQSQIRAAGLEFQAIGESEFPLGTTAQSLVGLGKLSGFAAVQYSVSMFKQQVAVTLKDVPTAIKKAGVEALLVDQISLEGGTIAELLDIPFITVCSALLVNREPSVPPYFTNWTYNPIWWAQLRNKVGYKLIDIIAKPIIELITAYRRERNLPRLTNSNTYSQLAQISQQPAEFEFPRQQLPQWFHFTGPFHNSIGRKPVDFPYEKLTGKTLIYASMGTTQNRLFKVYNHIAEACSGLDVQLVISLGGGLAVESLPELTGSPLVVGYAPQLELLKKATLTITHAGLNTTLESLNNGVPMVAIPNAFEQSGIAARIAWTGTGEAVSLAGLSVPKLRGAIKRVLQEDSYRKNAVRLQKAIRQAGGVGRAADIVEQAVFTGKPVLRNLTYETNQSR